MRGSVPKSVLLNKHSLERLKKKWARFMADSIAAGDSKQAANWQEAIGENPKGR